MLTFINIFLLLLATSITAQEAGFNLHAGPSLNLIDLQRPHEQDFLFHENDYQTGFDRGVSLFYNYHLDDKLFFGLEGIYRNFDATFRQRESEIINVDGEDAPGVFEHLFQFNAQQLSFILKAGYKFDRTYSANIGLSIATPLTDFDIKSRETIVLPRNAGVFKLEGERVRNRQETSLRPLATVFGFQVGANALFPMNSRETIFLKPSLSYTHNLTNNTEQLQDWTTHFLDIALGVSFIIGDNQLFVQRNREVKPAFQLLLFELQGTVERDFRKLTIHYDEAIDLRNGDSRPLVKDDNRTLIAYVSIDNLNRRLANFRILFDDNIVFQEVISKNTNKIFIPLDTLISSLEDNSLQLEIVTDDAYDYSRALDIDFVKQDEISYLSSDSERELVEHITSHKENKLTLYTDFENVTKLLRNLSVSNLTILPMNSFPYTTSRLLDKRFLLIVE